MSARGDNRLPMLANEIETAHEAVRGAFRTTLERAAHCGRLLAEAKSLVGHGGWLQWIQQNTTVGPREAQRYMRVAGRWAEIEANTSAVTYLTLTDAVALLAEPKDEPAPGSWEWAEAQLEGPFNAWDFENRRSGWLASKLMHKVGVSPMADMALTNKDLSLLRAVPADELRESLQLMAAVVKQEVAPPEIRGVDPLKAWIALKVSAQWIFVKLWDEIERRQGRDDDTLQREAMAALDKAKKTLEHKRASLDSLKQRHAAGELSNDEYGLGLIELCGEARP